MGRLALSGYYQPLPFSRSSSLGLWQPQSECDGLTHLYSWGPLDEEKEPRGFGALINVELRKKCEG